VLIIPSSIVAERAVQRPLTLITVDPGYVYSFSTFYFPPIPSIAPSIRELMDASSNQAKFLSIILFSQGPEIEMPLKRRSKR
jgi:hypothetical protein